MTSRVIKLVFSFIFAGLVSAILICVLFCLHDGLAWLCMALGFAAGWASGILLSPYESEQARFKDFTKLVSAFVTGYLVSKLDRLFEVWLDPTRGSIMLNEVFAYRALICITSFLLAAISTYIGRKYVSFGPGAELSQNPDASAGPSQES